MIVNRAFAGFHLEPSQPKTSHPKTRSVDSFLRRYSEFMSDPERIGLVEVPKTLLASKSKYKKFHPEGDASYKKAWCVEIFAWCWFLWGGWFFRNGMGEISGHFWRLSWVELHAFTSQRSTISASNDLWLLPLNGVQNPAQASLLIRQESFTEIYCDMQHTENWRTVMLLQWLL